MKKKQEKITKLELVEMISDRAGIPRSKAGEVLNVLRNIFKEAALEEKKILVRNFFKAEPYVTSPRKVRVPRTKKIVKTKAKKKIKIHIADALVKEINAAKKGKK